MADVLRCPFCETILSSTEAAHDEIELHAFRIVEIARRLPRIGPDLPIETTMAQHMILSQATMLRAIAGVACHIVTKPDQPLLHLEV